MSVPVYPLHSRRGEDFFLSSVCFGNKNRYQDCFQRLYSSSNEVLCSDVIPRWDVLGWFFTTCTHPVAAVHAKMALFYDGERDNIMNKGKHSENFLQAIKTLF